MVCAELAVHEFSDSGCVGALDVKLTVHVSKTDDLFSLELIEDVKHDGGNTDSGKVSGSSKSLYKLINAILLFVDYESLIHKKPRLQKTKGALESKALSSADRSESRIYDAIC
jgi:hypothetical protein